LLTPKEASDYIGLVRRKVLDSLDTVRLTPDNQLLDGGFVYRMVVQHEHMHDETMLATHQLRRGRPALPTTDDLPAPRGGRLAAEAYVEAGPFTMGTSTDPWAFDNERPAHTVHVPAFWIDVTPVSNDAYRVFV